MGLPLAAAPRARDPVRPRRLPHGLCRDYGAGESPPEPGHAPQGRLEGPARRRQTTHRREGAHHLRAASGPSNLQGLPVVEPEVLRAAGGSGPEGDRWPRASSRRLPAYPDDPGSHLWPASSARSLRLLGRLRALPRRAQGYKGHRTRAPPVGGHRILHLDAVAREGEAREARLLPERAGSGLRAVCPLAKRPPRHGGPHRLLFRAREPGAHRLLCLAGRRGGGVRGTDRGGTGPPQEEFPETTRRGLPGRGASRGAPRGPRRRGCFRAAL